MHLMVLGLYLLLFNIVKGEKYVDQGFLEYQKSVDIRIQEINTILRQQAVQLQQQSERIQNLEGIVATQATEIQQLRQNTESLQNESLNQKNHIKSLESTVDDQRNEIRTLKFKQSKSITDLSSLVLQIKGRIKTTLRKPFSDMNLRTSLPTEGPTEDLGQPQQKESVKRSKGFTGFFTAPVGGVYGFIYNIRMGCHTTNPHARGPFEIIRNNGVEGVVFIDDQTCQNQVTVTGNVIINANLGDKIYVRSHTSYQIDGHIYSDTNGRSSFAGWLIQET